MTKKQSTERNDFNGSSYSTTLEYFKFTLKNTDEVRNGETRRQWFERCHDIGLREFAKIVRAREPRTEFLRIMDIKNRSNLGRTNNEK